jgi:N-acylneuraminate cytidylyltransferase
MRDYSVLIPARGGSKGIPRKNLKLIDSHELIYYSIKQALSCSKASRVVVSTDDEEIAAKALEFGAEVPFIRPDFCSNDLASTESVIDHFLAYLDSTEESNCESHIILLQPTSPIRLYNTLDVAVTEYESGNFNSLVSVIEDHSFIWANPEAPSANYDFVNRPRRQDIEKVDLRYKENGSIYIFNIKEYRSNRCRIIEPVRLFLQSDIERFDIDTELDFEFVKFLIEQGFTDVY